MPGPYGKPTTRVSVCLSYVERIRAAAAAFADYAHELGERLISEPSQLAVFWERLTATTSGLVIIDFLDEANWDCFTEARYDEASGVLKLIWEQCGYAISPGHSKEMVPGEMSGFLMRLQSVQVTAKNSLVLFMLRG